MEDYAAILNTCSSIQAAISVAQSLKASKVCNLKNRYLFLECFKGSASWFFADSKRDSKF